MLKIKKIQDKEEIKVLSQKYDPNVGNCEIRGYSTEYQGHDCMKDCIRAGKPKWFQSQAC